MSCLGIGHSNMGVAGHRAFNTERAAALSSGFVKVNEVWHLWGLVQ